MKSNSYTMVVAALLLMFLTVQPASAQNSRIQLIHNSGDNDAASLEVIVDGDSTTTFSFREATAFMDMTPGEHTFQFLSHILSDTSTADTVTLVDGMTYVGVVSGVTNTNDDLGKYDNPFDRDITLNMFVISDAREAATDGGMVDLIAFHGGTDAPALDIVNQGTGSPLFDDLDYGQASAYLSVIPAMFNLDITPSDDNSTALANFEADLSAQAGQSLVVFASGYVDPEKNEGALKLGLFAAKADGEVLAFEDVTPGVPGPWTDAGSADWHFDDFLGGDSLAAAGHGVAVDKNGMLWVANFGGSLRVVDANGVDAEFSPIDSVHVGANSITTSGGRGLGIADDGNILFGRSGGDFAKINIETGEGMAYYKHTGSVLKPAVDADGFIYVGKVVGINPIVVLDPSFFTPVQEITLNGPPSFGRGLEVRTDGKTIYTPDLGGSGGPVYVWTSTDLVTYTKTDSIFNNTEGKAIFETQRTTMDWGPDSTLWVSSDNAYAAGNNEPNGFVILNFADMSYTFLSSPEIGEGIGNGPRGVAFTASGDTAYATYFNGNRVSRFLRGPATSVRGRNVLPSGYELAQNFPNPFNPTTTISFQIAQSDKVSLKIYNTLGQEVAALVDGKRLNAGRHVVNFDASNLASGVYFYKLKVNKLQVTKKMTIMK